MARKTVGIREFRQHLAKYLYSGEPVTVERHGQTLGFFIPATKLPTKADIEAFSAAKKKVDELIATWGATEEELVAECEALAKADRREKAQCQLNRW